ncbi:AmpG family muropeptide MFS transporter [Nitrococcus mobilis]|uniref:Putative transport transmembrane protein n=1 Tax=Nitrococcus mobilis Nb-231 TaxID=314278 RepID=A4BNP7_9GAMM|nr:MFS transporter [Nitrococcus mobilis]EAR22846.1 putative transport transmembrane protein [Nitrococcus mobilis Nb-231]
MASVTPGVCNWRAALGIYLRRSVITMVFLGFSAGLPFMLIFATLTVWLRETGVDHTEIGFFSWLGVTYSIKVLWAPVIDHLSVPGLTRLLGKRRSWMLAGQIGIAAGLLGISCIDPAADLRVLAGFGFIVAFCSATQDIAVDAFRIEAEEEIYQGAMAATYQIGYRIANVVSYTGVLYLASIGSWHMAYQVMAGLMLLGMATVLLSREPEHPPRAVVGLVKRPVGTVVMRTERIRYGLHTFSAWFGGAVIAPLVDFFARNGWLALAILAFIGCFRISDIAMASMANPLYIDLGFSKPQIANISGVYGLCMTLLGAMVGGTVVVRYGLMRPLLLAAILASSTNVLFAYLAVQGKSMGLLTLTISADNLSGGFAGAVFIAYLSSLTNTMYTATQYALFSSLMTLPGKLVSGFSGMVVDAQGYAAFFLYTALLGVPAIVLVTYLLRRSETGARALPAARQNSVSLRRPTNREAIQAKEQSS